MATFFRRLFGFGRIRARRSSLPLQPAKWRRTILSLERLEDRIAPATLAVNSTADSTAASNDLTLREAILLVNNGGNAQNALGRSLTAGEAGQISGTFGDNDTIQFDPGLNGQTITLNGSDLTISKSVTITGPGASSLAISGNNQSGTFFIDAAAPVNITGLTIEEGSSAGDISNYLGTLTVNSCTIADNTATDLNGNSDGVGISNNGVLMVSNSTLYGNDTAFLNGDGGTAYVINSTIADNHGDGLDNMDKAYVINSTLADNQGEGIVNYFIDDGAVVKLNNTIVAGNASGDLKNLDAGLGIGISGSNDLIGDGSDLSSLTDSLHGDPLLAPLGDYGGLTQTMALLPGSPAIDAGSNALAVDANGKPLTTDQRGQPRISGNAVDIGAFESQGFTITATNGSNQSMLVNGTFARPLTVRVAANNAAEPVDGGVVTFTAPSSGASAALSAASATISGGLAAVTPKANASAGSYTITASASGAGTPASFALTNVVGPATLVVNSDADTTAASNELTLPEAILLVDNNGNAQAALGRALTPGEQNQIWGGTFGNDDTIEFDAALNGQTITLSGSALPAISHDVTIIGLGAGNLAISGNDQSGIFTIDAGAQVSITGLTIEDGNAGNNSGGGIYSSGTLTLTANTFNNCSASNGGAIFEQQGAVSLSQSTLSNNTASSGAGGGIYVNNGTLRVTASTLVDNSANQYDGGGVFVSSGSVRITNSTFDGNTAGAGGGLWNYSASALDIVNSTFAGNTSTNYAGGITSYAAVTTLVNSIVANNGSADLSGSFAGSYDLIGDGSDLSSFTNSLQGNPLLAPLGNYGGPTQTFALLPGSPAIDAGSNALAVDDDGKPLTTDQRAQPRILGSAVDIGAYESQGLEGASPSTIYSLSNGNLYNTSTNQVIAGNVASFAQNNQGELCYLQNNGQLWFYGDDVPVATNVAQFAIDAAGAVVYLGQNGVLHALTVSQPLDNGTPIVLFKMDGAATAVALDQNGNLIRFTPGAETPNKLDHTVTDSTGKVISSVVTFALDGTGSVVVLDSNGNLNRFTPGSNTPQSLDTDVSKFVIDGAGSIVALEATGLTTAVPLANEQMYRAPIYNLVGFVTDPTDGSLVKTPMDTGVTTMVLDGAGSVVALDNLATSKVTLANGQIFSTPSYTMVRFAPGSTVKQTIDDTGVTQLALNGAGSIVALDSLTTTPPVILGNGHSSSAPVYTLVEFAPGSTVRQVLDSGVSRFAVDAVGDVVALDNLTLQNETLTNGLIASYPLWSLVSFAASTGKQQVIDPLVSTFVLDGSGSVVALDNLSFMNFTNIFQQQYPVASTASSDPSYDLVRLLPGATPGSYVRRIMDQNVSQIVVDASGAVFALDSKYLWGSDIPVYKGLVRFAPGSDQGVTVDKVVSSIAVDGSGSVVALDSPVQGPLPSSSGANASYTYIETLYNLVRFAPGSVNPTPQIMDKGVSAFTEDASGAVIALDTLSIGPNGMIGQLSLFSPGSDTAQVMAPTQGPQGVVGSPVTSFTLDGAGDVVALIDPTSTHTYTLVRFTPGSATPQQLDTNVNSFEIDGFGDIVALKDNRLLLERFYPGINTPQTLLALTGGAVSTYVVDGSGSVVALSNNVLFHFAPGSNTAQQMSPAGVMVSNIVVDASGSVVALYNGGLYLFAPGSTNGVLSAGGGENFPSLQGGSIIDGGEITEMNEDGSGSVIALVGPDPTSKIAFTGSPLVRFTPGLTSVTLLQSNTAEFIVDGSGAVFALTNGHNTLPDGSLAPSTLYNLVRFAPGATQSSPFLGVNLDNVSNYYVDSTGSVWALDASEHILWLFAPGSGVPIEMNYVYNSVTAGAIAFVVDGAGYLVAMEYLPSSDGGESLVQYTPGSATGVRIAAYVQSFALNAGSVIALESYDNGLGDVVLFAPGSTNPQGIDTNVNEMAIDASGSIIALDNYNTAASSGTLVRFIPNTYTRQVLDNNPVNFFFVDKEGVVIDLDTRSFANLTNNCLVAFSSQQEYTPNTFVQFVDQFALLPDGYMLVLTRVGVDGEPSDVLLAYAPGIYTDYDNMTPIASNLKGFYVPPGTTGYPEWSSKMNDSNSGELVYNPKESVWDYIVQGLEVVGTLVVTFLTAGTADPFIALAAQAGDALVSQTINHFAFGTPFNLGSIAIGALGGAIGADGGVINVLEDAGDAVGGVVGDVTDAIGDVADSISDTVGELVDPESFLGQTLSKSFDSFVTSGGSFSAALSSLEDSVAEGIINSTFVQSTEQYLSNAVSNAVASLPGVQDGVALLNEIASDGLSGTPFGQTAGSLLANAAKNVLAGKPIFQNEFQNAVSALGQFVSSELGNTPFSQEGVALMNQALTNGVNANLANNLFSFLGQTAADELANSSFVQDGLSFLNQTLADGLGDSSLVQDGVSFLQNTVANGIAGSNFAQQVSSFLQQIGADGLNSLNSTITGEVGSFLQDAAQAGTDFANSTLGGDVGIFLQQAAQNGVDFLNSSFVGDAVSFLQQAVTAGSSVLNSPFANDAVSFMQQVSQAGLSLANSNFAIDGQALLNSALSGNLGSLPFGQDVGAFLDQVVSNNGLATSSFAATAVSFLQQAVAAGQTSSNFTSGAFTLLNGVVSAKLTNTFQSIALSANNTISTQFQANNSSDADAILNFVNQLPSYNNSPMTVTLNLADGVSSSGVPASPPPGVTLIIIGQGGTTTTAGHWNVTSTAVNTSAVYSPHSQTVTLNANVAVVSDPSIQVNEGAVTFTVKSGQTVVGTPVQGSVSGGTASASFSLPAGQSPGNYTIAVSYSNSQGNIIDSGDTNAILAVQTAPTVTSGNSAAFIAGQGGSFTVTTTGFPAAALKVTGTLPSGIIFTDNGNGTATLAGTPAAGSSGIYTLHFTAANSAGSVDQTFTLTVNQAPAITSGNSTTLTVGLSGSFTVTTTGSPVPTLSESGALPSGTMFTDNGNGTATLSGVPAASGTYHFTIIAQNAAGDFTQSFTLAVNPAAPKVPSLLVFFDSLLGGTETINANGTETIVDSLFGIALLVSTFDSSGRLVSVDLFGFNVTFLFV
jgi:hypothetical protein